MREGGFGAQPLGVVAGGDQQLASGLDSHPGEGDQGGSGRGDQRLQLGVELVELGLELLPAAGQGPQGGLGGGRLGWSAALAASPRTPDQRLGCESE
jgi:hypothetical protein